MKRALLYVGLSVLLLGCVNDPELVRPAIGPHQERTVLNALDHIKATREQRIAVLNAYDAGNGRLRDLAVQSHRIIAKWHQLDRLAPDFQAQVDALSVQWAEVNAEEMKSRAAYEHGVALAISPKQWGDWQDFMNSQPPGPDEYTDSSGRVRR